ncbi:putative protein CHUP1 [Helianthus anomalus]
MQIKLESVKLAKQYMRRVATELQTKGTMEKDSSMDFAGGFDADTMQAFEELRNVALVLNRK